jgi:hypothetical protein
MDGGKSDDDGLLLRMCLSYVLGSMAAAKVFIDQNRPNMSLKSSSWLPAPNLTDFGRYHSW